MESCNTVFHQLNDPLSVMSVVSVVQKPTYTSKFIYFIHFFFHLVRKKNCIFS